MSEKTKQKRKRARPLVVILGPTASGKTELAIYLATRFYGEIVNADSRALYKEFPILSGAPYPKELKTVPHHLFQIRSTNKPMNLYEYLKLARKTIEQIRSRYKLPVVVGGSALYVNALIYGYKPRKVKVRQPMPYELPRDTLVIGMKLEKDEIKKRIKKRFDRMIASGVAGEVRKARPKFPIIGVGTFRKYVAHDIDKQTALALYTKENLGFVKKQMTWFKRDKNIHWVKNKKDAEKLVKSFL